jgi:hypothetical protein
MTRLEHRYLRALASLIGQPQRTAAPQPSGLNRETLRHLGWSPLSGAVPPRNRNPLWE